MKARTGALHTRSRDAMTDETTRHELSARFDPTGIEAPIYARWIERGAFHVDAAEAGAPYVIAIPPPNVTAALHMGHGLNNTIQDVLIRFQRMRGRDAMWIPGTGSPVRVSIVFTTEA